MEIGIALPLERRTLNVLYNEIIKLKISMTSHRVWLTMPAKIHVLNAPSEYLMQSSCVLAKASKIIKSGSV